MKNRLKEIRMKEYMMTSSEFAKLLGVPLSTYSQWESGINAPTLQKVLEISNVLNRDIKEIWYLE